MRILKSGAGLGYRQYMILLQLTGNKFLVIGYEDAGPLPLDIDHEVGTHVLLNMGEVRDSIPATFDEVKNYIDPKLQELLAHLKEKEEREAEDAKLNSTFLVAERTSTYETYQIKAMLHEMGLPHHYSDGGLLRVRCASGDRNLYIQTFRNLGIQAGQNWNDMAIN